MLLNFRRRWFYRCGSWSGHSRFLGEVGLVIVGVVAAYPEILRQSLAGTRTALAAHTILFVQSFLLPRAGLLYRS